MEDLNLFEICFNWPKINGLTKKILQIILNHCVSQNIFIYVKSLDIMLSDILIIHLNYSEHFRRNYMNPLLYDYYFAIYSICVSCKVKFC